MGGAETVTVINGVASVTLTNDVAETFEVAISSTLTDPANDSLTVTADAATQVAITQAGADFIAGASTVLEVTVQDQFGNAVLTDQTTQITFTPTLSGTISGPDTVTVVNGVASVTLTNDVAETF